MNYNVKPENLLNRYSITFTRNFHRIVSKHLVLMGKNYIQKIASIPKYFVSIFPTVNGYLRDHLIAMILKQLTNKFYKLMMTIVTTVSTYATVLKEKELIVALTYWVKYTLDKHYKLCCAICSLMITVLFCTLKHTT